MANRICSWCKDIMGEISWSENDTHGICNSCARSLKENELVRFSLILLDCLPFNEVVTRAGAASILRAVRNNENYVNYSVEAA